MENESGLEIVLTPIQLAAILEKETIEETNTLSNRLWGTVTLIGGAFELVGAAALFLVPEPTSVTKIAGGVLGAHGIDTASTGIRQIASGHAQTTWTAQAAETAAGIVGADPNTAAKVGMVIDTVVPLIAGFAGAARAIAIRRGAISLTAQEAAGGHTIARHVGRTEAQLRARLAAESRIPIASTFHTLKDAERFVAEALRANRQVIKAWAKTATPGQTKGFTYNAGCAVGQGVVRSTGQLQKMTNMMVVVRKVQTHNRIYFILTAYPKL